MGKYALVENNTVVNVIVINEANLEEMSVLGELVDAVPLGLCIGDLRNGANWTRNLNGVQTILEPLTPDAQTDFTTLVDSLNNANTVIDILAGGGTV